MAISIVQTANNGGAFPINFTSNVTAGSTVFFVAQCYGAGNMTCNTPTLGGSTVSGTTAFFNAGTTNGLNQLTGGNVMFLTMWMLPNCAGGSKNVTTSISGTSGQVGVIVYEVSGLGTSPTVDKIANASGSATAMDSTSTAAITSASEFILGAAATFAGSGAGPTSPWTVIGPSTHAFAGYQIASSSGGTYDWAQTASASGSPWDAAVVTIAATVAAPPSLMKYGFI